jgi:hypothetical protein
MMRQTLITKLIVRITDMTLPDILVYQLLLGSGSYIRRLLLHRVHGLLVTIADDCMCSEIALFKRRWTDFCKARHL